MTKEEAMRCIGRAVKSDVNMAKIADAIKVIEQNSIKGRWIPYLKEGLVVKCSECGSRFSLRYNYCPNCGADMREVEE